MQDIQATMLAMGRAARAAARELARANTASKNAALAAIAQRIRTQSKEIVSANAKDVAEAKKGG
ncbi:MAG TPA: gamma-glutamyl-phosphate reductase, partial [Burkholderiales bacterium]|nr:gamma-glutamyl-phosphate reductase [Burkholderiales bacterium]